MKKYNVIFFHAKDHERETVKDITASEKRKAAHVARSETGYLDPHAYQVLKVEEVK